MWVIISLCLATEASDKAVGGQALMCVGGGPGLLTSLSMGYQKKDRLDIKLDI